jgi:hypothetical protein
MHFFMFSKYGRPFILLINIFKNYEIRSEIVVILEKPCWAKFDIINFFTINNNFRKDFTSFVIAFHRKIYKLSNYYQLSIEKHLRIS